MKAKKIIASMMAILMMLSSNLTVRASTVEKATVPSFSKVTYKDVFAGVNVTVTDKKTQAVRIGAYEWPFTSKTKMYFIDDSGNNLGYINAETYMAIDKNYSAKYGQIWNNMPGGIEGWYAQLFNDYRGVKRLTVDEYLSINKIRSSALSGEDWKILEQVYGKSTSDSSNEKKPSASSESGSQSGTAADASGWPSTVVRLTNQERANEGLPALSEDPQLMKLAALRAKELAVLFSHTRPNGERAIIWAKDETGFSGVGENIAAGYTSPQHVMEGWMNSSGHRANILKERYTAMGAGYYKDPKTNKYYWVQLFAYSSSGSSSSGNKAASDGSTYELNKTELTLKAGEGYQLSVDVSGSDKAVEIEWVGSKIGKDILAVDDSGYVTTFYRSGLTSATATLNVSAKIYVSGKLVKTLNCKITVTQ